MKDHVGMPGQRGSLGQCALCGDSFLKEILLGQTVALIDVDGCYQTIYAHKDCLKKYGENLDVLQLPEASPLRQSVVEKVTNNAVIKKEV